MSSAGLATLSSASNSQLITDALADYAKTTGVDLCNNPFTAAVKQSNSPEAILELLHEQEKAFKGYRDNDRKLTDSLASSVKVIQAFSGSLGAVTLVSHKYDLVTLLNRLRQVPFPPLTAVFAGISVLLDVRPLNTLYNQFTFDQ